MSAEDRMNIGERRKYLRKMQKRYHKASREEQAAGRGGSGDGVASQEPAPADERRELVRASPVRRIPWQERQPVMRLREKTDLPAPTLAARPGDLKDEIGNWVFS